MRNFAFCSKERAAYILHVLQTSEQIFRGFVGGQLVVALLLGVMYFVGMTLCGFPYATVISLLVAVLSLIPILGTLISALIGCFLILVAAPEKSGILSYYTLCCSASKQTCFILRLWARLSVFRAVGAGGGDDWREPWRCCRYDCLRTAVFCTVCFVG